MYHLIDLKKVTYKEIEEILKSPDKFKEGNPTANMGIFPAGPLYKLLWLLSCAATVFAREYIESQPDKESFLKIFEKHGFRYIDFTILNLALDIDIRLNLSGNFRIMTEIEEKGLPPKETEKVVQCFFEKIIGAVNEQIICLGSII